MQERASTTTGNAITSAMPKQLAITFNTDYGPVMKIKNELEKLNAIGLVDVEYGNQDMRSGKATLSLKQVMPEKLFESLKALCKTVDEVTPR